MNQTEKALLLAGEIGGKNRLNCIAELDPTAADQANALEKGDSRDLPLRGTIEVESTVELPRHYTVDSIFMDVMADPKAATVMRDFMKKTMEIFGREEQENNSDAAKEAITEEMNMAMMNYMPLRGAFSFGGATPEQAEELLKKLNE